MTKNPRHAPADGKKRIAPELLYDPNVAKASHAEQAMTLAEKMPTGTLCTMAASHEGFPYGSFVTYAIHEGDPVFLISLLAEHTKNLRRERKASLMIAEALGDGDPLALARVTLVGECHPVAEQERDAVKEVFLAKHPTADFYVDFKDFGFWKLKTAGIRYIGGFGRMSWVDHTEWVKAEPDPLAPFAKGVIDHMNEDHADTMVLYCKTMSKAVDTTEAEMVSLDRYGFEMKATTAEGPRPIRLAFSKPLENVQEVRKEMVAMAHKARDTSA